MSRLSTVTEYWDKTPRNHKQLTFILLSHAIVVRRNSGGFRIVVSSLVCSLHEKMFWQNSRERDHGEDQHAEQNHPALWSLGLCSERVMLFTNKNSLIMLHEIRETVCLFVNKLLTPGWTAG